MMRKFSLTDPRYDQSSFKGRLKWFLEVTNPLTCLTSSAKLELYKNHLKQFKEGTLDPAVTDKELWDARICLSSTFARDGAKIPVPFRTSGYATGNLPICVGMMMPAIGYPTMIFWQWANQTQNALFNHFNRSSSKAVAPEVMMKSYVGAVTAAVSISVGTMAALKRVKNDVLRTNLRRTVPFLSVATANVLNTYLMRRHELGEGIAVMDGQETVGVSKIAAKRALVATCASRAFMSFCMLAFPPFVYPFVERSKLIRRVPKLYLPAQFSVVAAMIYCVIPCMLALFKEEMPIKANELEPEIASKFGKDKVLIFNKGL